MDKDLQISTRPQIPPDPNWTPQEQWVWERVQAGATADFNTTQGYRGRLNPKEPTEWPDNRILRPAFLEAILLHEPYRTALPHQGVRIEGAWWQDPLDLSYATLTQLLWLQDCRFEAQVDLRALQAPHLLSLQFSVFNAHVNMESLHVSGALFMRYATFEGVDRNGVAVNLNGARIEDQITMRRATVSGQLNMESLHVGRHLFMRGVTLVKGNLSSARIEDQLDMSGATVSGQLSMESLHVGGDLVMCVYKERDDVPAIKATFAEVVLDGARIEGRLDMSDATVSGQLNMNGLHVGGDLLMHRSVLTPKDFSPGQSRNLSFMLTFAEIDGTLSLGGAWLPTLNLAGTRIGENLQFTGESNAQWHPAAQLHLYNTEVGGSQDVPDASPHIVRLEGFTYNRLVALVTGQPLPRTAQRALGNSLTTWLERQQPYAPQPYEQLASVLQRAGYKSMAIRSLYESTKREQRETWHSALHCFHVQLTLHAALEAAMLLLSWFWLFFQRVFIGYGYYNFRVLWSVLLFCALGVLVLQWSGQGPAQKMPYGISYSVDMLLPIIKLNKKHDDVTPHLTDAVRWYFYAHQLVGYTLASFLVAGLTGLTKKNQ